MEKSQRSALQNFRERNTDILKKRLLETTHMSAVTNLMNNQVQQNVLLNTLKVSQYLFIFYVINNQDVLGLYEHYT